MNGILLTPTVGGTVFVGTYYETKVLDLLEERLPIDCPLLDFKTGLIWGYFSLDRDNIFDKKIKKGSLVKKSNLFKLRSVHFGKLEYKTPLRDLEGKEVGTLFHLISDRYINYFFLPNEEFIWYGSNLIFYFGKLNK